MAESGRSISLNSTWFDDRYWVKRTFGLSGKS
jgi:hypothetical protein